MSNILDREADLLIIENDELRNKIAALEAERDAALEAEREACALIADEHKSYWGRSIAREIRSRGQGRGTI